MKRFHLRIAGIFLIITVTSAMLASSPPARAQGTTAATASVPLCLATGGPNYEAQAMSGYGTDKGTGGHMTTWNSWSLNGHSNGYSDETVWTIDYNNKVNSLEVGFVVGITPYGGYGNYMYPFWTQDNGGSGKVYLNTVLPEGTSIWNSATSDGTHSWAYVNNTLLKEISYGVQTPRWNFQQAEVDYHDIWMGGGAGAFSDLYYQSGSNNNWYTWGYVNTQLVPSPQAGEDGYFIDSFSSYEVEEGGYGQCPGY